MKAALLLTLLCLIPIPASAVFKCIDPTSKNVTYQDDPCKGGVQVDTSSALQVTDTGTKKGAEKNGAASAARDSEECARSARIIRGQLGKPPSKEISALIKGERRAMADMGCKYIP
jgi:hypothetical protein